MFEVPAADCCQSAVWPRSVVFHSVLCSLTQAPKGKPTLHIPHQRVLHSSTRAVSITIEINVSV